MGLGGKQIVAEAKVRLLCEPGGADPMPSSQTFREDGTA